MDVNWIPGYFPNPIDTSIKRQFLFQLLVHPPLSTFGFLALSIIGRLLSFGLLALGLTQLGKALRIGPVCLALAVITFFNNQSIVAGEWIVSGFEPKVLSYGLALLSLAWSIEPIPPIRRIFVILGFACSLHVLVGFYASIAIIGALFLQGTTRAEIHRHWRSSLLSFLLGGAFAIWCAAIHLFSPSPTRIPQELSNTAMYVFYRSAHHLDPRVWSSLWWLAGLGYLLAFLLLCWWLQKNFSKQDSRALKTIHYTILLSLIPFLTGLCIYHFDNQGKIMQLYLFRFADVMLPLCTCLLGASLLQRISEHYRAAAYVSGLILICTLGFYLTKTSRQFDSIAHFPGSEQKITTDWLDVTQWANTYTKADDLFIVPPVGAESFPWLARRRIYGTFKQVALSGGLQSWHQRMSKLANQKDWPIGGKAAASWINERYRFLGEDEVLRIMEEDDAQYFITNSGHQLSFPTAYHNAKFTVYERPAHATRER
ncbi:MAG: hypothetical protein KDD62_04700 [Bdellovibrionales bacterium]|nr:hypothetical protein [Bdellovibrionales bacterium]